MGDDQALFAPDANDKALLALMGEPEVPDLSSLTESELNRCMTLSHFDAMEQVLSGIRRFTRAEFIAVLKVRNPKLRAMPDDEFFKLVLQAHPEWRKWIDGNNESLSSPLG